MLEVRADGLLRVRDLLEGEAGGEVLLVWAYPQPHFWRMCSGGFRWLHWRGCRLTALEALAAIVAHAGGPATDAPAAARRAWLAEHFEAMHRRVSAVTSVRSKELLENIPTTQGWSEYVLPPGMSEGVGALLADSDDVYRGELSEQDRAAGFTAIYDWYLPRHAKEAQGRRELLGRVLRRAETWRAEATGREKLTSLQLAFWRVLGQPAQAAEGEFPQEPGKQGLEEIPEEDAALVPPALRADPFPADLKSYLLLKSQEGGKRTTPVCAASGCRPASAGA